MRRLRHGQPALGRQGDRARRAQGARRRSRRTPPRSGAADRVVFPGQGAMPDCMRYLREYGLDETVREAAASKPLLGRVHRRADAVRSQRRGRHAGPGRCSPARSSASARTRCACPTAQRLKVPHMGWNRVRQMQAHPLWDGHSRRQLVLLRPQLLSSVPADPRISAGESTYGGAFTCVVASDNIFATQFHPEKSSAAGLRIYENFTRWNP